MALRMAVVVVALGAGQPRDFGMPKEPPRAEELQRRRFPLKRSSPKTVAELIVAFGNPNGRILSLGKEGVEVLAPKEGTSVTAPGGWPQSALRVAFDRPTQTLLARG